MVLIGNWLPTVELNYVDGHYYDRNFPRQKSQPKFILVALYEHAQAFHSNKLRNEIGGYKLYASHKLEKLFVPVQQ